MNWYTGLLTNRSSGTNYTTENGHEIWNLERDESPQARVTESKCKRISEAHVRLTGSGEYRWSDGKTMALVSRGL